MLNKLDRSRMSDAERLTWSGALLYVLRDRRFYAYACEQRNVQSNKALEKVKSDDNLLGFVKWLKHWYQNAVYGHLACAKHSINLGCVVQTRMRGLLQLRLA